MNSGSWESLKVSLRWGWRPIARRIRLTVLWLNPDCCADDRALQWVASRGRDSSVVVSTLSTSASLTRRGVPGRGSSSKPSNPLLRNRERHLLTVCCRTSTCRATTVLGLPSEQARMILARMASTGAVFGRRTQFSSVLRCSSAIVNATIGRPVHISFVHERRGAIVLQRTLDTEHYVISP